MSANLDKGLVQVKPGALQIRNRGPGGPLFRDSGPSGKQNHVLTKDSTRDSTIQALEAKGFENQQSTTLKLTLNPKP